MTSGNWDAVIFDYGGVLSYPPCHQELLELGRSSGLDDTSFLKLYADTRDYYGRSPVDYTQHWLRVAEGLGLQVNSAFVERFIRLESNLWIHPNDEVLAVVRSVRQAGLKTAILSNMTFDLLGKLRERLDWLCEFDVQVWSCEEGRSKPDLAIYRTCLAALHCDPSRALFFDDRRPNVDAASQVGIDAHIFNSAEQARAIVERGISLP